MIVNIGPVKKKKIKPITENKPPPPPHDTNSPGSEKSEGGEEDVEDMLKKLLMGEDRQRYGNTKRLRRSEG